MILLDIAPEAVSETTWPILDVKQSEQETQIVRSANGEVLGWAKQSENPKNSVRFFQGKGGFSAVVTNEAFQLVALPGSHLILGDTEVELPGELLVGKTKFNISAQPSTAVQQVTQQAMILGAGLATRFEPVSGETTEYSKPAVPLVGHDSVIVTIAKHLKRHGITRILVNTYYKPERLKEQLSALEGIDVIYIDEIRPSGTAGGLVKALELGLVNRDEPIIIIQGDAVTDADLSLLLNTHQDKHAVLTIGGQVVSDEDVDKFGMIQTDVSTVDGQSGKIKAFQEKPSLQEAGACRFANAGFYVLDPALFDAFTVQGHELLRQGQIYDYAKDLFPQVLADVKAGKYGEKPFWAQAVGGYWSDIGNPVQYIEALRDIYEGRVQVDLPADTGAFYKEGIFYWPQTQEAVQQYQQKTPGFLLRGNIVVVPNP
jgi:NDP-sugar pyrophosphorylase family protein